MDGLRFHRADAGRVWSFSSRAEAEQEARKLAFGYLLRYEHIIGDNEDIQEVRCVFVELPPGPIAVPVSA